MREAAWMELIRRIPEKNHDQLVVVTSSGAEVVVQKILRLEEGFFIFRGRPMGSTDQAQVLMLPYDQLNYLAFNRPMTEKEIETIFGPGEGLATTVSKSQTPTSEGVPEKTQPEEKAPEEPGPAEGSQPVPKVSGKPVLPSKSVLLDRLRARLSK